MWEWRERVQELTGVEGNSTREPTRSGGIPGKSTRELTGEWRERVQEN
jgi:hypothetical protein